MTVPLDNAMLERLSAYIDDVLPANERAEIEALAVNNPDVAAEIAALRTLDVNLTAGFDAMLSAPLPENLLPPRQPAPAPAANDNRAKSGFGRIVAALAMLAIGAGGGALATYQLAPRIEQQIVEIETPRGWMAEIADYHRVYATQSRHLAEVPASEKPHIEAWLGKTIGVPFSVPDLTASGYEFQGARLLVAAGKPVAQLLYTDTNGTVIAICALAGGAMQSDGFSEKSFGDINMVRWSTSAASYVVVGPEGVDLNVIATIASAKI
ncbi:MAG: anti-sigma factor family protein [Paracoccaceae bacterium]